MPFYDYTCVCGNIKEKMHGIKEQPEVLCDCGKRMMKAFNAGEVLGHVRGSTPGKAYKESKIRRKKNAELSVKQLERHGGKSRLVPNVAGEETTSWREASLLAADKGLDTTVHKAMAEKEKFTQNSAGIDERRWKKEKEKAKNIA